MSSKFNIELAQGTVTVEGDEEFIKAVYQALQATLLSGDTPAATPAPAETRKEDPGEAPAAAPELTSEIIKAPITFEESIPEESEATVTPITVAETGPEPAEISEKAAAPVYEPIPSVLDPERAERERAEAEEEARAAEEAEPEPATADRGSVLEKIKESLGDDMESGGQTSILQRIRDSLSEDSGDDEAEGTPRAADAG